MSEQDSQRTTNNLTEAASNPSAAMGRMKAFDFGEGTAMFDKADQIEISKAKGVADVLTGGIASNVATLLGFAITALGVVTVTIEVITRYKFGERYMTIIRLLLGISVMGSIATISNLGDMFGGRFSLANVGGNLLFLVATLGIGIGGIVHVIKASNRTQRGELWYSHSFGISRLIGLVGKRLGPFGTITEWSIYCTIEPLLMLIVGIGLGLVPFLRPFGTWLIIGSIMMFIRNNAAYQQQRGLQLDIIDSTIIKEFVQPIMEGTQSTKTAGYAGITLSRAAIASIPTPPEQSPITRDTMKAAAKDAMSSDKNTPTE